MKKTSDTPEIDDSEIESVISTAIPRAKPSPEAREAALAALSKEWEDLVVAKKRRKHSVGFAVAASVVLAFSLVLAARTGLLTPEPQTFGQIARSVGDGPLIQRPDEFDTDLVDAGLLIEGDAVTTPDGGRILVHLSGGGALRIDHNTRVELRAGPVLRLRQGAIYFDSRGGNAEPHSDTPLSIETPAGTVTHLGTQYMARVDLSGTTVAVREGSVAIRSPGVSSIADAGRMIRFDRRNRATDQPLSAHAPAWDWVMEIAPSMVLQRASAADILAWIARESGRRIEYEDGAEKFADEMIDGLPNVAPLTALGALGVATGLEIELADSTIRVRAKPGNQGGT